MFLEMFEFSSRKQTFDNAKSCASVAFVQKKKEKEKNIQKTTKIKSKIKIKVNQNGHLHSNVRTQIYTIANEKCQF